MKVEKDEFLIDGRKSAMTTRRLRHGRPFQTLAAAIGKAWLPTIDSLMGGATRRLVLADRGIFCLSLCSAEVWANFLGVFDFSTALCAKFHRTVSHPSQVKENCGQARIGS